MIGAHPLASVAYAILRRDWETGKTTNFVWEDLTALKPAISHQRSSLPRSMRPAISVMSSSRPDATSMMNS